MHSKDGHVLVVGAKVSVEFLVSGLHEGADTCNISLRRDLAGEQLLTLTCQAKQCTLVGAPAETPGTAPAASPVDEAVAEPVAEPAAVEEEAPGPPARCDCPALDVPHTHEQGGPVPIEAATPE